MYFDSAYIAKYYLNEPDSPAVRKLAQAAHPRLSSQLALVEVASVFRRHVREGKLSEEHARIALDAYFTHVDKGIWELLPVADRLLRRCSVLVSGLPAGVFLRAGDAIHLTTALDAREPEVWTNDRHLLAAAPYFGITGRSV